MDYREFSPEPDLANLVKCIWVMESEALPETPPPERILPDGCTELILHYGDRFCEIREGERCLQPRSFYYGQIKRYIEVGPTGRSGVLGVRFFPHGAAPFLPELPARLAGKPNALTELFGETGQDLEDQVLRANAIEERLSAVNVFLREGLKEGPAQDKAIAQAVQLLTESHGQTPVEELAAAVHLGTRQFERRFSAAVGLSPKVLSRITRFQQAFRWVKEPQIDSLAALAHACGYFDQAHFIRDFKAFSGINPRSWFATAHPFSDHLTSGN